MTKPSIYVVTRAKLEQHGVGRTVASRAIFQDKKLFLRFVELERAKRSHDIDAIQNSVREIDRHLKLINRYYLILFAYMYVLFSENSAHHHLPELMENGWTRYTTDHRWPLSDEERTIQLWASQMYARYGDHLWRALRAAEARRESEG